MKQPPNLVQFRSVLREVCQADTAAGNGVGWTPENPTHGHCAVVSLLAQQFYGGDLMRVSLEGTKFAEARSHYFNRHPNGEEFDLTLEQFPGGLPKLEAAVRDRKTTIGPPDTRMRYARLAFRVAKALSDENPLFDDPFYAQCLDLAYRSPCQKTGFGALLVNAKGTVVAAAYNGPAPETAHECENGCVRIGIPSRMDAMRGACMHAEQRVLMEGLRNRIDLSRHDLYVAGLLDNGLPFIKTESAHTCKLCAISMHITGVRRVFVPVHDDWEELTTSQALETASQYLKEQHAKKQRES